MKDYDAKYTKTGKTQQKENKQPDWKNGQKTCIVTSPKKDIQLTNKHM